MALKPGMQVGPYEITAPIGAGGMGEVYRATDTKLKREVAIKVLPDDVAGDPDRLARFEREALVLASLNHPNIASIYGLEESGGVPCLVLELVDGQTLAERLAAGALPVEQALGVAKQIAWALEAAHEKGVIHRDLKPANVKITPEGSVKVLDFGLAKAFADEPTEISGDASLSPTLTMSATRAGVILGTAAYMSPEQARGKPVDKRTDVWAFGCVFYEMLTGRQAFPGETASDCIVGILGREPDWDPLPAHTPLKVRELLQRCLTKDPRNRLHDIADARIEIEEAQTPRVDATPEQGNRASLSMRSPIVLFILAATTVAASVVVVTLVNRRPAEQRVLKTTILAPEGAIFDLNPDNPGFPVLSPDGTMLAFSALDNDGESRLYVRPLRSDQPYALTGTEEAGYPFWSPDSQWLAFFSNSDKKLKKVEASGGLPVPICDAIEVKGGSWSRDGLIVFAKNAAGPLHQVRATGGPSTPITQLNSERGDLSHRFPRFLPDGQHFLYLARIAEGDPVILVGSLDGQQKRQLLRSPAIAEYAAGHLLFFRGTSIMAQPFDVERLALSGEATSQASATASYRRPRRICWSTATGTSRFGWSGSAETAAIAAALETPPTSGRFPSRRTARQRHSP
jgi:serine/threonine protein kinase